MSKRELLANALERTGLGSWLSLTVGRWGGLLVFNYHRVGDPAVSPFDHALWSATQEEFERQIRFLKQNFEVVRVADLDDLLDRSRRRAVMITFDDGYRDNYELAFPVLQRNNVPATFFIASGFLDQRPIAWWDEIAWMVRCSACQELPACGWNPRACPMRTADEQERLIQRLLKIYKTLPSQETGQFLETLAELTASGRCPPQIASDLWMTWEMVREMDRGGMDLGGHTVSHPVLANSTLAIQREEIFRSKQRIEAELGHPITAFSYPVGQPESFNAETKALLQEAGYEWAFSFFGGFCSTRENDRLALPRVAVSPHVSQALFRSTARLPWLFA